MHTILLGSKIGVSLSEGAEGTLPRISMHPKAWDAGYADGLAGRLHGNDPLSQVDELAYASGYVEGKAAAGKGWIPDEPRHSDRND